MNKGIVEKKIHEISLCEEFYSNLIIDNITVKDYKHGKKVWKELE